MKNNTHYFLLLISRTVLFFVLQLFLSFVFHIFEKEDPLRSSAAFWPLVVVIGSVLSLLFLLQILKNEGEGYKNLIAFNRGTIKKDILVYLVLSIISAPISFLPNIFLANLLLGSQEVSLSLLIQPIPAIILVPLLLLFPLLISFSELPIYFGFLLPKLTNIIGEWKALFITVFFLSFQHSFLPFLINFNFFLWRFLMYLPFALFLGLVIKFRPRMLPYLMIGHFLMDSMTIAMYLIFKAYY